MVMRESTVAGTLWRDATETQRRSPNERETSKGKVQGRVQERGEMKMRETGMQIDGKRAHGIGEVIKKGIEEMRGTRRRGGKGTKW